MKPHAIDYRSARHSVFLLHAHLVFTPKYRKAIFCGEHLEAMERIFRRICENFGVMLVEFNGEVDHVHLLIEMHPTVAVSAMASSLKTVTARRLRHEFAQHLRAYYWKPRFWASAYAAFSVGSADLETVKRYIQNQEKPH